MLNALKNFGFILLVLMITAGIYFVINMDSKSKQDLLYSSLNLLGDKLLAMVPESEKKEPVKKMYDEFLDQSSKRTLSPEKIEHVAANILNLSMFKKTITPEQARSLLEYSLADPSDIKTVENNLEKIESSERIPHSIDKAVKNIPKEQWEDLANRIKSLNEFNNNFLAAVKNIAKDEVQIYEQIKYRAEDKLKVQIDLGLKNKLRQKQFVELAQKLEQQKMLEWQDNLKLKIDHELDMLHIEMDSINQINDLQKLEAFKDLKSLQFLKGFDEQLQKFKPFANADCLHIIVETDTDTAEVIHKRK